MSVRLPFTKIHQFLFAMVSVSFLVGCAGTRHEQVAPAVERDFNGSYAGFESFEVTGPTVRTVSFTNKITIFIDEFGVVVVNDGATAYRGQISGNSFSAKANVDKPVPIAGLMCKGPQSYSGSIEGDVISGDFFAEYRCVTVGGIERTDLTFIGTFQTIKTNARVMLYKPQSKAT